MVVELLVLSKVTEAVVSQTIRRLSDLLIQEAKSLASVRDDVERFRNELRWMQCFLSSADGRQAESVNELVRNWVSEIRNVACDIEDVIEIFIVKMEQASYLTASFHLRTLRKQIDSIKARMRSIFDSRVHYNIRFDNTDQAAVAGPSAVELRRSYPDNEEEEEEEENGVTGLDDTRVALKNRLMEEQDELCAIPIVGMGGLGKTTLAKIVFNDSDVKQYFNCCVWVLISQQYVARDVFSEILMQIGYSQSRFTTAEEILEERRREREHLKTMEESELISLIRNNLRGRRYLVVLDDIWRVDTWNSIKRIFPRGNRGSKAVFTTRMMELASHADPRGSAIEPPLLTYEESWELLRRKAFSSNAFGERVCPPEFENLGREMVRKCGGLPHALVVLGGLLRTKTSEEEWRRVLQDVNVHLNRYRHGQQYRVEEMIALSYHDLPYFLKPCFLYLGSFPGDLEIPRRILIQLWIAEGLVTEPIITASGQTTEEIADQYLRELIDRCMVQVGSKDYAGVGVKTCRVQHLIRDFCMSKAREDNFSEVIRQEEIRNRMERLRTFSNQQLTLQTKTRRIAIHAGCDLDPSQMHPCLRSLLCFDVSSPTSLVK